MNDPLYELLEIDWLYDAALGRVVASSDSGHVSICEDALATDMGPHEKAAFSKALGQLMSPIMAKQIRKVLQGKSDKDG
jgi:hypothetical protein